MWLALNDAHSVAAELVTNIENQPSKENPPVIQIENDELADKADLLGQHNEPPPHHTRLRPKRCQDYRCEEFTNIIDSATGGPQPKQRRRRQERSTNSKPQHFSSIMVRFCGASMSSFSQQQIGSVFRRIARSLEG